MSTFDSQNTGISSSTVSSAERYGLDTEHPKKILVYRVRGGYEVTTEKALSQELDKGALAHTFVFIIATIADVGNSG